MATKKPPAQPDTEEDRPLEDADGNLIDPEEGGTTPADLDAPTVSAPPASMDPDAVQSAPSPLDPSILAVDDTTAVTMADVAALNGIGLAPDASTVRIVDVQAERPFISAGMASDLEYQGWTNDPLTGRLIQREEKE